MADQSYRVIYDVDGNAEARIDALIAKLTVLDVLSDRIKPKLKSLTSGLSAGLNASAKAATTAAAGFDKLATATTTAQTSVSGFGAAAKTAAAGAKSAGQSSGSAAKGVGQLGTAAAKASGAVAGIGMAASGATAAIQGIGVAAVGARAGVQGIGVATSGAARAAARAAAQFAATTVAINGVAGAATGAVGPLNAARGAVRGIGSTSTKASVGVNNFLIKSIALREAHAIFSMVLSESEKLEARWKELAKEAGIFRDSLKELASLKGESGPNPKVQAAVLELARKARIKPEQAKELSAAYENIGPTVREKGAYQPEQKGVTPEKLEADILAEAGGAAQRLGVEPKAMGNLVGTAGLFNKFKNVSDAMEQIGGAVKGIQEGKLAYTPGIEALNSASAKLLNPRHADMTDEEKADAAGAKAGRVGSLARAGVYLGALSLGTDTAPKSAHRMVQTSRVLNPDASKTTAAKALAEAGLTDQMDDPAKLIRLGEYFKEQKITDPGAWLVKHKLGTVTTREGTVAALKNADVLKTRLAKVDASSAKGPDGKPLNTIGKQFISDTQVSMASDPNAEAAGIESKHEIMDQVEGLNGPLSLETAKKAAALRMRIKDKTYYDSVLRGIADTMATVFTFPLSGVSGAGQVLERQLEYGAIPELVKQGEKVGIDVNKEFPNVNAGGYRTRSKAFQDAATAVRAKGGDPLGQRDADTAVETEIKGLGPQVPMANPAAGPAAGLGAPKVGPGASLDNPGGGPIVAMADPKLNDLNREQAQTLKRIEGLLRFGGGGNDGGTGPLMPDGGDYGPRRT